MGYFLKESGKSMVQTLGEFMFMTVVPQTVTTTKLQSNKLVIGRSGYFQEATTIHERYVAKPISDNPDVEGRLEKICLAQFATSYTPINKLPQKAEIIDENSDRGCSKALSSQKIFNSDTQLP